MKNDKLSQKIESLYGDEGVIYTPDEGISWYVKYEEMATPSLLAKAKVPLTLEQALVVFERAKDIILLEMERKGAELLKKAH